MDHADLIMMRAPSPVLVCAATKDFFDIGGTWDTFRYAKRLYTRLGFAERVDILENDAGHNYNTLQREGVARWMSRWLLGKDQAITEPQITLLTEKEYQCTPDGKVMSLPGARSVYDLNEDYENELAKRRAVGLGNRRPNGPAGSSAAAGRHPQALGVAETADRDRGDGCANGLQHREAPDQARGGRVAAGVAVLAREAQHGPRRAVRSPARQGGRRGPRRAHRAAGPGRRVRAGRRSSRDGTDASGQPRTAATPTNSRMRISPISWAARTLGCGRKTCSSAPGTRRNGPPADGRAWFASSRSATSAFPRCMRRLWSRACSGA